ncbi:DUF5116 domain-containing protein [Dysgonomonas sp. 520]|uniref:DUF5116 domain-containing protein n=1 Tax=Dysgonomonas sp. 520 TaxID=2302931 RepID=UPI0013D5D0B6|nr:DUF5116 domain-containing protein [Dysgonomonas sp. 520]NDW11053.1 DUF5116 domain-containing protein [Dysgonomonas sp. 520]
MKNKLKTSILALFIAISIHAQVKAPLYWSVYEYCYEASGNQMNGGAIPEDVWQKNIDWVAETLKPYGYNIICIDGWGDDNAFNENGYRTKHATGQGESGSVNWRHDYVWWSKYIQSKGMTLGIYNNPLWINKKASDCRIKGREDLTVGSLINHEENSMWFTWVQVDRPGAEEYVKNYIQYYADMGVKYLRVDFLSWFEDGKDKVSGLSTTIDRPTAYYQTALRWMKEACDKNDMTLSLVMPHLYNDAASEILATPNSLIRINEDVCDGGWHRLSEIGRGKAHDIWSKYHNMFDGFVYWSKISDKMILDGDFTRLNTFANDNEKQTAISLQLMAGGPIAVADQYNTIGNNLKFYINEEMLELNKSGFVGKPLSDNPKGVKSQIWKGQLPCGNWIIGLFNREDEAQLRSFDFETELGIKKGIVRDLWKHENIGIKSSLSEDIEPHGCKIYKISNTTSALMDKTDSTGDIQFIPLSNKQLQIKGVNVGILNIFNLHGRLLVKENICSNPQLFDLCMMNNGVYIADLIYGQNKIVEKICIK